MLCRILGSGWAIPTPRPFTNSRITELARNNPRLQRDCSCFWVDDIKTLVDCPETVGNSANKAWIVDIENLFITHWHPDHCFGLRLVLESRYNFYTHAAIPLNLYLPRAVYDDIKKVYPSIDFFINVKKCAKLIFVEDGEVLEIGDIKIQVIGYTDKDPHWFAYLFSQNKKSLLYLPCDTIGFERGIPKVDILIHECGILSPEVQDELLFENLVGRIKHSSPWRTILTHIEEIELVRHQAFFETLEEAYRDLNIELAFDGMEINL